MGGGGRAPRPERARDERAHLVRIDETGLLLDPLVRRTWAKEGRTPGVGGGGGHRKKASVIGAVTVSPRARRVGLYFANRVDGYFDAGAVVGFLRDLLKALVGKVVVVWGGGGNHTGPLARAFPRRNTRLPLGRLPAHAPDLNPVEAVWSRLKCGQLADFVPTTWPNWTMRSSTGASG